MKLCIRPSDTLDRSGFTLIELLTVIAIIGILAAIIIPVVGKVRQSAKTATATSNLRQIGMAATLYASDTKVYPDGFRPGWAGTWDGLLAPYVAAANSQWGGWGGANTEVFVDPARGIIPPPSGSGAPVAALTFSANPNVFPDRAGSDAKPVRPETVRRPPKPLLVATGAQKADGYAPALLRSTYDVFDSTASNADVPIFQNVVEDGASGAEGHPAYRHKDRALAVMADTSVKSFRPGDLTRKNFSPYY